MSENTTAAVLESRGICPTCGSESQFVAEREPLRNNYRCLRCGSAPRERALAAVIELLYPNWRSLCIHESSPGGHTARYRLATEATHLLQSQFFPGTSSGEFVDGIRCENLEEMSFEDGTIDLHITQDVMEHIFCPELTFREIARTLAPGGAHIFTVPLVNGYRPSEMRATLRGNQVVHAKEPPQYHENPVSREGSLVTWDWGFDICQHIFDACGLFTHVFHIDDVSRGIRAQLNHVLATVKPR
jgi:SAM-dependent methyltransferase